MKRFFIILLMAFFFTGCCKKEYPAKTLVQDTVTVTRQVKVRDTVFEVPGAEVKALIPTFSQREKEEQSSEGRNEIFKKNRQASLRLRILHDTVFASCKCDTMAIRAKLRDNLKTVNKVHTVIQTKVVKEKYVPTFVTVLAWIGGAAILFVIGFFGIKLFL